MTGGERGATKLVGLALYGLIVYIVLSAAAALGFRFEPAASPLGIGLTIASLVIMAALWRWRLALADRLGSPALRGDAACSMVCLYMAGVARAGLPPGFRSRGPDQISLLRSSSSGLNVIQQQS